MAQNGMNSRSAIICTRVQGIVAARSAHSPKNTHPMQNDKVRGARRLAAPGRQPRLELGDRNAVREGHGNQVDRPILAQMQPSLGLWPDPDQSPETADELPIPGDCGTGKRLDGT